MKGKPRPAIRIAAALLLLVPVGFIIWSALGPSRRPDFPRWKTTDAMAGKIAITEARTRDVEFIRRLMADNPSDRRFPFATVVLASSDKTVIPLDDSDPVHRRVTGALRAALDESRDELGRPGSPVRSLRRINEASRHFEDLLRAKLDAHDDLSCDIPHDRAGASRRSGYPDLRLVHLASGTVFYIDPKLVEDGAWQGTLRTFYFEPKAETLKIADDAVHLLVGIGHNGRPGEWEFTGSKIVDLSELSVRLKAEFQASNADIYKD